MPRPIADTPHSSSWGTERAITQVSTAPKISVRKRNETLSSGFYTKFSNGHDEKMLKNIKILIWRSVNNINSKNHQRKGERQKKFIKCIASYKLLLFLRCLIKFKDELNRINFLIELLKTWIYLLWLVLIGMFYPIGIF